MKRLIKLPLYFFMATLIIILAVVYIYSFTTLPETELNNYIRGLVSKKIGYDVSFRKINRDIWNRVEMEEVEISSRDGGRLPIAYISRIELDYNFWDLLGGNYIFRTLVVDSLSARVPEGGFGVSSKAKGSDSKGGGKIALVFEQIKLRTARIALNDTDIVNLDSLEASFGLINGRMIAKLLNLQGDLPARDIVLHSISGSLHSSGERYQVDSLAIDIGNSDIVLSGSTGQSFTGGLDIEYEFRPVDLEDVYKLTGVKLQGEIVAHGHLKGAIDNFEVQGLVDGMFMQRPLDSVEVALSYSEKELRISSIQGDIFNARFSGSGSLNLGVKPERYTYLGEVRHLDLREIAPELRTDFTGQVSMRGEGFKPENFRMAIDGDLDSVRVEAYYFDKVSGSVEFDDETIHFLPGFQGRYKDTFVGVEGHLEYQGELDITGQADFQDLTNFAGQTFLRELGGRGKADFHITGPTIDFSVRASFESDSCWTYGLEPRHISIYADLNSFISHQVGHVQGNWTGGKAYSVPTDSGRFESSVSGERVFFDYFSVDGPQGFAVMRGAYDGTSIPPAFYADTLYGYFAGNRFTSRRPVILDIDGEVTEFRQAVIGLDAGTVIARGHVTNDTLTDNIWLNLDIEAADFQIQPVVEQFYRDKKLSGYWWGEANLRGSFDNPRIDFNIEIDSLNIDDVPLGKLHARLNYRDGYIYTDSTHLESDFGQYYFSGALPLNMSFDEVDNRLPADPIDFGMVAAGTRLVLGEVFIPTVERFETDFRFEAKITGTYSAPHISGWGYLLDGELKVLDLVNPLTGLRAYFRMENETIHLDSAFAFTPGEWEWLRGIEELLPVGKDDDKESRPQLQASGTMRLITLGKFEYDIDVDGRNFFCIADAYDVRGLADLNLRVAGTTPPTVSGEIILNRLDIRDEFDAFIAPDFDPSLITEDSTLWNLNLHIEADNNIWIKNADIDAELKGDLFVERNVGILSTLGQLDFIRGTYNLVGQKFRIKPGSTLNFDNVMTINPELNITVTTRLRNRETGGQSVQPVELILTGTLLEPKIEVAQESVESGITREELLTSLIAGSQINPFASGSGQSSLSRNIARGLISNIPTLIPLGGNFVEELEIDPTPEDPEISIAKYISSSLYVRYSQRLYEASGRSIGVEYYLNDNVTFTISRGRVEGNENEEGISFDLNLNFEY